jgi:hypothetical protein
VKRLSERSRILVLRFITSWCHCVCMWGILTNVVGKNGRGIVNCCQKKFVILVSIIQEVRWTYMLTLRTSSLLCLQGLCNVHVYDEIHQ